MTPVLERAAAAMSAWDAYGRDIRARLDALDLAPDDRDTLSEAADVMSPVVPKLTAALYELARLCQNAADAADPRRPAE